MTTTRRKPLLNRTPSIAGAEAYMTSHGWRKIDTSGPNQNVNVMIYHGPADVEGNPLTIALPARADLSDAKFLLDRAVRILSTVEARSRAAIVREIADFVEIGSGRRPHGLGAKQKKSHQPAAAA